MNRPFTANGLSSGNAEPVEITGFSLAETSLEMYVGRSGSLTFNRVPDNANNYELVWTSSDESVATVSGNKRRATVNGVGAGTATHYLHRYG